MPAIDASVVVQQLLFEEFGSQARTLLEESYRASLPLYVPTHMISEVLSAVYQRLRRRRDPDIYN